MSAAAPLVTLRKAQRARQWLERRCIIRNLSSRTTNRVRRVSKIESTLIVQLGVGQLDVPESLLRNELDLQLN